MMRHTVVFRLQHAKGSAEERKFLDHARILASIPSVGNFEQLRQVSPKSDFTFGFSMEFEDQAGYDAYNVHPVHEAFLRQRWLVEVEDFLEIDDIAL